MNVLRKMLKYAGYYIMTMMAVGFLAPAAVSDLLTSLCGATLSVSMFAAIFQMIVGGDMGKTAGKISEWCLNGTAAVTVIAVIAGIGLDNIAGLFKG